MLTQKNVGCAAPMLTYDVILPSNITFLLAQCWIKQFNPITSGPNGQDILRNNICKNVQFLKSCSKILFCLKRFPKSSVFHSLPLMFYTYPQGVSDRIHALWNKISILFAKSYNVFFCFDCKVLILRWRFSFCINSNRNIFNFLFTAIAKDV